MNAADRPLPPDVDREARRAAVAGTPQLNGIDFVELLTGRRILLAHLLNRAEPAVLTTATVAITGGKRPDPRINPVVVRWTRPAVLLEDPPGWAPPGGWWDPDDPGRVRSALEFEDRRRVLLVGTSSSGDSSPYELHLLRPEGDDVLPGFDPVLSRIPFSFRADAPDAFDPRTVTPPAVAAPVPSPLTDYLARDADALRARLLDRFAALVPGWSDGNPADPAVMMMELFAALGDRLAYWQDAVAVEAYLGTARRRTSVRRHARLLDYPMGEGCSARTWLAYATDTTVPLPAGTAVADTPVDPDTSAADAEAVGAVVFEPCDPQPVPAGGRAGRLLRPERNALALYAWQDPDHDLPVDARSAFVALPRAAEDCVPVRGDVLILADCPPGDPRREDTPRRRFDRTRDGDPRLRFAVRLDRDPVRYTDPLAPDLLVLRIHWHAADALPAPLRVSGRDGDTVVTRAVALANVVLADHGATVVPDEPLLPARPQPGVAYRPRTTRGGPAWVDPCPGPEVDAAATDLQRPDPRSAVPALRLIDRRRVWTARRDLLASGPTAADVVVEPEADGTARLRFGDGVNGRRPGTQTPLLARYRVGGGARGNVGADRLVHFVGDPAGGAQVVVWNPLPATGGADPEDTERVRRLAPASFRRAQPRAVTSADYASAAEATEGVQRSLARRRWNGSWYAQEVTLDLIGGATGDDTVSARVAGQLESRRMAGVDVEIGMIAYAVLWIGLTARAEAGFVAPVVEERLRAALSARRLPGGTRGFFHPDNFTFGQPLYVSDLVVAALAVPGVAAVEVGRFGRFSDPPPGGGWAVGRIDVQAREVVRCDSDPEQPEAGRVDVTVEGGS